MTMKSYNKDLDITPSNICIRAREKYDEFTRNVVENKKKAKNYSLALLGANYLIGFALYACSEDELIMVFVKFGVALVALIYSYFTYENYYKETQNYAELAHYLRRNYIEYKNHRGEFAGEDAYDKFLAILLNIDDMKFKNETELLTGRKDFTEKNIQNINPLNNNDGK